MAWIKIELACKGCYCADCSLMEHSLSAMCCNVFEGELTMDFWPDGSFRGYLRLLECLESEVI